MRTGAASLTTATAAVSGCVSNLPPLGSQVQFGRVDVPPAPGDPIYTAWTPPSSDFPSDEYDGEPIAVLPSAFRNDSVARRVSLARTLVLSRLDYLGRPFEAYDLAVAIGPIVVLAGPIVRSRMAAFLADTGYSSAGTVGRFDRYYRPDGNRHLAVTDGTLLFGRGADSQEALAYLQRLATGDRPTRSGTDDTFARFCDRIGASPGTMFGFPFVTRAAENAIHSAHSFRFDDEALYYVFDHRYPTERDVSQSAVREAIRERGLAQDPVLVDTEVDGVHATIELRQDRPVDNDPHPRETPQVMWGWEVDPDDHGIALRHEAGDSFGAEHAEISHVNGATDVQFDDEYDVVEPGDSLTLGLQADAFGEELHVTYDLGGHSSVALVVIEPEASP